MGWTHDSLVKFNQWCSLVQSLHGWPSSFQASWLLKFEVVFPGPHFRQRHPEFHRFILLTIRGCPTFSSLEFDAGNMTGNHHFKREKARDYTICFKRIISLTPIPYFLHLLVVVCPTVFLLYKVAMIRFLLVQSHIAINLLRFPRTIPWYVCFHFL